MQVAEQSIGYKNIPHDFSLIPGYGFSTWVRLRFKIAYTVEYYTTASLKIGNPKIKWWQNTMVKIGWRPTIESPIWRDNV